MKKDLNNVALDIYALCIQHGIHLSVDWVPRNQNQLADDLSKLPDWDDWGIHTRIFRLLNSTYGPFTIDVYASNVTKKLPRFYSKYWCGGTLGVDGLAFDWGGEVCWWVPPPLTWWLTLSHMPECAEQKVY